MTGDRVPVLVNAGGGAAASKGDKLADEIRAAFADTGLTIDLRLCEGKALHDAIARHGDAPLIVVGGGDGTIGCAAGALAGRRAALGILPLGTLNHFARELKIPMDVPAAAALIAQRPLRHVDLGRVNDHVFINNVSIGFYPLLVREREEKQERGLPKWLAAIPAARAALHKLPTHRLELDLPDGVRKVATPMLFVGNNRYALELGKVGKRYALDEGLLSVFAVARRSRVALIGFALRTLLGRADPQQDFAEVASVAAFDVDDGSSDREIGIDGEVVELEFPLRFRIDPRALTVVAPA